MRMRRLPDSEAIAGGKQSMARRYMVSDGRRVLTLEVAEEGGYVVTSPLDPELITQGETVEEAFANARDAARGLKRSRAKLSRRLASSAPSPPALRGRGLG